MKMKIAVAGGTGTVGRLIVAQAGQRGHEVSVIARSAGVDLTTGNGLDAALEGADVVIDAVSVNTMSAAESVAFFGSTSRTLIEHAARADVDHLVLLSIVGIDRNPHGYYAGKLAQEDAYLSSGMPVTVLRATQFHEFAAQVAGQARLGPVQLAPRARVQPVAAADVARRVIELAEGAPQSRASDIAGPREEQLSDLIRAWVRHEGRRGPVIGVNLPGAQMRGMRAGSALPSSGADLVGPNYGEWLAAQGSPEG